MKFATVTLASLLVLHADATSRTKTKILGRRQRKSALRRDLSTNGRNRPAENYEDQKEGNSVSSGVVSSSVINPADAYANDSFEGEERNDCDGYFVKLDFKTDRKGDETGVFLVMEKVDKTEMKFVLSAPAMSLNNDENYGEFEFCLEEDNNHCYHLDISDLGDNGFNKDDDDAGVFMTVTDSDDNKVEFNYDGKWHDKIEIDSDFGDFRYAGFVWGENSKCGDDSRQDSGDDSDSGDDNDSGDDDSDDSREDEDAPKDIDDECASGDNNKIEVKMELKTEDKHADDIAITLKEDNDKIWDYDEGSFKDDTTYKWTACVADDKCTKFKFYDSDGKFDGSLELTVDDKEVQGDDDSVEFDDNELVVKIGDCSDDDGDDSREDDEDAPETIDDTSNCDEDDMMEIDMNLETADEDDTKSLAVSLTEDGTVIWDYDEGSFKAETTYDWKTCVDGTVCSEFTFYHDGDLGGSLTLNVDGKTVGEGGSGTTGTWDKDKVTVKIGKCDDDDGDSSEDDEYAPETINDTSNCDEDDMIEVEMEMVTKENAETINITLTEDGEEIWDYGEGSFKDETTYNWKTCVDGNECSKFKASHSVCSPSTSSDGEGDGEDDGECDGGSLTLKIDGNEVGSGSSGTSGKWEEDEVTVNIGKC